MALSLLLDTTQGCTSFVGRTSQTGVLRTFTIGADTGKAEMIAAAKARGFDPVDDNHADALALLDWAMAQGGVA
ncbi:hypothetical protein JCM16106_16670 [Hydrogenophilus islandicus]